MRSKVFFLILLLSMSFGRVHSAPDEGYGEDNDSLGQFTDTFTDENYIEFKEYVIVNNTLECVELNYIEGSEISDDEFQLREHLRLESWPPIITYSIQDDLSVEHASTQVSIAFSYQFLVIDKEYLDGKYVRWRWRQYNNFDSPGSQVCNAYIYDGSYDRSNNLHFPDAAPMATFGAGLLQHMGQVTKDWGWGDWETLDHFVDLENSTLSFVTLFWRLHDSWNSKICKMQIDWIEINAGSFGTGNIITFDFEDETNIVMENTGSYQDYGYVNVTNLPMGSAGGYSTSGWFNTTNLMTSLNGSGLVLLTNATIPYDTLLTVQFSNDEGATWTDNMGVEGSNELTEGFLSIDLRELNDTDQWFRYNFTGLADETPRLYQTRLIATDYEVEEAAIVEVVESDFPWIAIAIILSIISGLLFTRMKR